MPSKHIISDTTLATAPRRSASYGKILREADSLLDGIGRIQKLLMEVRLDLARDLKFDEDKAFIDEIRADIEHLGSTIETRPIASRPSFASSNEALVINPLQGAERKEAR